MFVIVRGDFARVPVVRLDELDVFRNAVFHSLGTASLKGKRKAQRDQGDDLISTKGDLLALVQGLVKQPLFRRERSEVGVRIRNVDVS
jgi:DNA-binding MarR family transcriptional regulator